MARAGGRGENENEGIREVRMRDGRKERGNATKKS